MKRRSVFFVLFQLALVFGFCVDAANVFVINQSAPNYITPSYFNVTPVGGDTIKILSERTTNLKFDGFQGNGNAPIVFINSGGQVKLWADYYGVLTFSNCKYIKVSGKGDPNVRFGFRLSGPTFGLSFIELSSDCEAEFLEIDSCSLGIDAKKDYWYNPPVPYPIFKNLAIHDNYIHDCCEGMYIGETKSPGMEFRHVRIYNNVIMNSGRESMQLANCVEDVEVYNNLGYNAGKDHTTFQMYNCQMGGNTVGRVYNNIFKKNPAQGIPYFGKGDVSIFNNYLEDNMGIFSDDRFMSVEGGYFKLQNNYFRNPVGDGSLACVWNKPFDIYLRDNKFNVQKNFLNRSSYLAPVIENSDNILTNVDSLLYTVQNGVFQLESNCPSQYIGMGPIPGLTHAFNSTPVLDSIPDIYINIGDTIDIPVHASTTDNDSLTIYGRKLPGFVSLHSFGNGNSILKVDARGQLKKIYSTTILVTDVSNGAINRQSLKIAVKDPMNTPATFSMPTSVTVEAATKLKLNISGIDNEHDSIRYTIKGLPYFVVFSSTRDSAYLNINPTNINEGSYTIIVTAEDGYSNSSVTDTLVLNVTPASLTANRILYRVAYGMPSADVEDYPINWQMDYGNYRSYLANYSMGTGAGRVENPWNVPTNVFGCFRYTGVGMQDMLFEYPCKPGRYLVNLFFAERSLEVLYNTVGTFGIYLEDSLMQDSVNIYNEVGYNALKKSFAIDVRDGNLSLKLRKLINMAKINGVEIIYKEAINVAPVIGDIAPQTMYEGDTLEIKPQISDDFFNASDTLSLSLNNSPNFLTLKKVNGEYVMNCAPDYSASGNYSVQFSVSDGVFTTSKTFSLTIQDFHINPPVFVSVNKSVITEGIKDTISVVFSDPDNDNMTLSAINLPSFAQFVSVTNGTGRIILTPTYSDAGSYAVQVKALDSFGFATIKNISFTVLDGYEVVRIPLTSSMITDLGGSYYSSVPSNWVNEQNIDPLLNEHPTSGVWSADANALPCQFYLNLGHKYVIKKMYFHDMYNIGTLYVSSGIPTSWNSLFSVYTNDFNRWRMFNTDVSTQYLKFSINDATAPQINELAIYGYLDPNEVTAEFNGQKTIQSLNPLNPEESELVVNNVFCDKSVGVLNVTTSERNFRVEVFTLTGTLVKASSEKQIDLGRLDQGVYLIHLRKQTGESLYHTKIVIP